MKISAPLTGLAFFAGINLLVSSHLPAQGPAITTLPTVISALVDYGSGLVIQPKKRDRLFAQLLLNANQTVTITLRYNPVFSGQEIIIEPLDGGTVTVPEGGAVIDQNGQVAFQFQASGKPGLSRISAHQYEDGDTLQFWIIDTVDPADNPPPFLID